MLIIIKNSSNLNSGDLELVSKLIIYVLKYYLESFMIFYFTWLVDILSFYSMLNQRIYVFYNITAQALVFNFSSLTKAN